MTNIERMAKEVGLTGDSLWLIGEEIPEFLAKFAALIAEECAKEVDRLQEWTFDKYPSPSPNPKVAAAAIRNRFPMPALSDK